MYAVVLEEPAKRFIRKLDEFHQSIISKKLRQLKTNPRLGKPLTANLAGYWSLRIGDYRAIYNIKDERLIVFILHVEHRKKVY